METLPPTFTMAGPWTSLEPSLHPFTLATIKKLGFQKMTPVQAAVIPRLLQHKDVVVEAMTGSGKTLAFVIPIVEILARREEEWKKGQVGGIVISPTRELAHQSAVVLEQFVDGRGWTILELVGGSKLDEDIALFQKQGGTILVGTPGRIEHFLTSVRSIRVRDLEVLVLDEADRLLDLGFERQLGAILDVLPKQRRTGLFSATQTESVEEIVRAGLRNPLRIRVTAKEEVIPDTLQNFYSIVPADTKLDHLISFLVEQTKKKSKCIVFMLTCASVDYIVDGFGSFAPLTCPVFGLHGQMTQNKRKTTLQRFHSQDNACVLVCTDVAARGIDFQDVDWIVQADPPQDPSVFVHRVGRTARLGRQGKAVVYILESELAYVDYLCLKQVPIKERSSVASSTSILEHMRDVAVKDRGLMIRGQRAFVSFVRAYRENRLPYIFRVANLDLCQVAQGYGLLYLPSMPELRSEKKRAKFLPPRPHVDIDSIPFHDKEREAARQRKKEQAVPRVKRERPVAWSKKKDRKERRTVRRDARHKKQMKKQGRGEEEEEELAALAREARLLKKLKQGKISEEEFERLVGEVDDV